jgi:ribosomal protein L14
VREAATATEAARIMTMLAVETSTQEAAAMGDSVVVHVKDLEDWAALVERVARKWV